MIKLLRALLGRPEGQSTTITDIKENNNGSIQTTTEDIPLFMGMTVETGVRSINIGNRKATAKALIIGLFTKYDDRSQGIIGLISQDKRENLELVRTLHKHEVVAYRVADKPLVPLNPNLKGVWLSCVRMTTEDEQERFRQGHILTFDVPTSNFDLAK